MKRRRRVECDRWGQETRDLVGVEALVFVWVVGRSGGTVDAEGLRRGRVGVIGWRGKEAGLLGAEKVLLHFGNGILGPPRDPASNDVGEGGSLKWVEEVAHCVSVGDEARG